MFFELFFSKGYFVPSLATLLAIRTGFGVALCVSLLVILPVWNLHFMGEKWGGYSDNTPGVRLFQNPLVSYFIFIIWCLCSLVLIFSEAPTCTTVLASFFCLVASYYFFVRMRWKSISRGMGAPGFLIFWLSLAVFLFEYCLAVDHASLPLATLVLQVDLAIIFLTAGISKLKSGYPQNEGIQFGLANPMWGYKWSLFSRVNPNHLIFKTLNHSAWSMQILAGILCLIPQTMFLGALILTGMFLIIPFGIRLGFLCPLVIISLLIYTHPGSVFDSIFKSVLPFEVDLSTSTSNLWWLSIWLQCFLVTYLIFRPIVLFGQWYNFFAKKHLPETMQKLVDHCGNIFGWFLWRVFTPDVLNFYVMIYKENILSGQRTLISRFDNLLDFRFNLVSESITVVSIFTTLKYFSNQPELFEKKLKRYSKTFKIEKNDLLVFKYVKLHKTPQGFDHRPAKEYYFDQKNDRIFEKNLSHQFDPHETHTYSPVSCGVKPGSYIPLST